MAIKPVSFGVQFKTREVANIVAGKEMASGKFLSDISGIPVYELLTRNSSDMYSASSDYCAKKIPQIHPVFQTLKDISDVLREEFYKIRFNDGKKPELIDSLFDARDKEIEAICSELGETIDIEPFKIPFLR